MARSHRITKNDPITHTDSPNKRYEEFVQLIGTNPELPRQELAKRLNVTRQTVQVWLRRYKSNRPVTRRGRPNKYGNIPSQTYTVRIPGDLIEELRAMFPGKSEKKLRSRVRNIIDSGMTDLIASFLSTASQSKTAAKPNRSGKTISRAANKIP